MRIEIPHFHGAGAREAKIGVYRMSGAKNVVNRSFSCWLDEHRQTAIYEITFHSAGWTGRTHEGLRFPLWMWRKVAALPHRKLSDWLLLKMKGLSNYG